MTRLASSIALLLAALAAGGAFAQEALGPMAGVGGVFRDAEDRVLQTPAPETSRPAEAPQQDASAPEPHAPEGDATLAAPDKGEAASAESGGAAYMPRTDGQSAPAPETDASAKAEPPQDLRVVGPVAAVRISGAEEFAEREGIAGAILAALDKDSSPDTPRTVEDVKSAISSVRESLVKKGFYLLRIWPDANDFYDKDAKSISVFVDDGKIGSVTIGFNGRDNGTWFSSEQIRRRFEAVKPGDTFDYSRLRSVLFEANSHPDLLIDTSIDAKASIVETADGRKYPSRAASIDLDVAESFPFHLVWEFNNFGIEDVEEWQTSLTMQYMNLTRHDDVLTIAPATSIGAELVSVAASYMLPHHWWRGGATTVYGGWSRLDVDNIVRHLDLDGTGSFAGLQHSENIIDDDSRLLAASAGILWRYLKDQYHVGYRDNSGSSRRYSLSSHNASILPLSLALSYTEKKPDSFGGRNFATIQGVWNFATFGDDLDEMWQDADDNYWILRWQLARLQPLFGWFDAKSGKDLHQWMLYVKLEGQYTPYTLIPTEKLQLGGYNCLRGYSTRGYIGDWGIYGTVELRTPILVDAFSSLFSDRTNTLPFDRIQFLGFIDYGWTNFNDLPSGYDDSEFLASGGVGTRLAVTKYTQLRCDLAFPFVDGNNDDDDDFEFYLSVQVQF